MSSIHALILGIVQGITEFLPVSSTAQIIIAGRLLGLGEEFRSAHGLSLEIFLHFPSVLAVMIYFYKDLINVVKGFFYYVSKRTKEHRGDFYLGVYIIIATIITAAIGFLVKDFVEDYMTTSAVMAITLTITGVFLIIIERFKKYGVRDKEDMRYKDSVIVGLAQALAVIPGLSRSGTTLIAGLWSGLSRDMAVRYSFLMSIPVILGVSLVEMISIGDNMLSDIGLSALIVGFISSFVFSIIGIVWLINFLKKGRLIYFSLYCFLMALLLITVIR